MPANIGEMFYTGVVPWHGEGVHLAQPATLEEALKVGGLKWKVGEVDLLTADEPPSPVTKRKAIVRLDRPPGHERRVLGVAHRGFRPLQNEDGALLFDAIFGGGRRVYHTGGYLGDGEVIWLLAKVDHPREVMPGDVIEPYALFTNSHDGSMAIHFRLTTIRVVCQNTLAMALNEREFGEQFSRAHQGTVRDHALAAQGFFAEAVKQLDATTAAFVSLAKARCSASQFQQLVNSLLPEPKRPKNAERNLGLLKAYERRLDEVRTARESIGHLWGSGKGMDLPGSRGTYWGALNAVLEFVDHHQGVKGSRLAYALLGDGMQLKARAYRMVQEEAQKAA